MPSIYVLDDGASSEPTNEEKAAAFVNKWKAYDDDFCANLKDETKKAELEALITEYDALDEAVKAIVSATEIKTGVTIENQIEYVRNSLSIPSQNNASNSLINITYSNDSTIIYIVVLSISIIALISYSLVLKSKKANN